MEKLTKEEVLKIRPGKTAVFQFDDGKAVHSARQIIQYVKNTSMPADVKDYTTSADWEQKMLIVTAIGK
jgi:hypothetical protein